MSDLTSTSRYILEIRLNKRIFSFLDFKGELIDYLLTEAGHDLVSLRQQRVETSKKDFSEKFFVSWENFGIQLESQNNSKNFKERAEKIINLLSAFGEYNFDSLARVGTRCQSIVHIKGTSLEGNTQKFKDKMFNGYEYLKTQTGFTHLDIGAVFNDIQDGQLKGHLLVGPVSKSEAIQKYFSDTTPLYESFSKQHGVYMDVDIYKDEQVSVSSSSDIVAHVEENIAKIESVTLGFTSYIRDKNGQ